MREDKILIPGMIYQLREGSKCQIITTAEWAEEKKEKIVVYQKLEKDYKVYAAREEEFWKNAYLPEKNTGDTEEEKKASTGEETGQVNPDLLRFLDADTNEERLNVLESIKEHLDERLLGQIAMSMDIVLDKGSVDEQYESLRYCLDTLIRFEGKHLR